MVAKRNYIRSKYCGIKIRTLIEQRELQTQDAKATSRFQNSQMAKYLTLRNFCVSSLNTLRDKDLLTQRFACNFSSIDLRYSDLFL